MGFRMKDELKARTKALAHKCVRLVAELPKGKLTDVISYQLIKSSTSTAANYRAACLAQSKPQLTSKLSIVIEELDETSFWTEFLQDEDLIRPSEAIEIRTECDELLTILISSRMTLKGN